MWPALSAALGLALAYHVLLPSYALLRKRAADPERWSRLYPPEQLPVVMRALEAISYSFLLRQGDVYRLEPSDRLMAIYRASYPVLWADSLEFESLMLELSENFAVPESELATLSEATVADVIALCLAEPRVVV